MALSISHSDWFNPVYPYVFGCPTGGHYIIPPTFPDQEHSLDMQCPVGGSDQCLVLGSSLSKDLSSGYMYHLT